MRLLLTAFMLLGVLLLFYWQDGSDVYGASLKAPHKVKVTSLKSRAQSKVIIRWRRTTCSGYQVQFCRNRYFINARKSLFSRKKTVAKQITGLEKGRIYYFRVRAFNQSGTRRRYGKWSRTSCCKVHAHSYRLTSISAATWSEPGKLHYRCSCGKNFARNSGEAAIGKSFPELSVTKAPTCENGLVKRTALGSELIMPAVEAHSAKVNEDGNFFCEKCGIPLRNIDTLYTDPVSGITRGVQFTAPEDTNSTSCVSCTVRNASGFTYNYKIYCQRADELAYTYPDRTAYLAAHGCSTCALTTVLNAVCPALANYTPDRVLEEVIRPAVGEEAFEANFSKKLSKQMPIGLKGISQVLSTYGIEHKYVYNYTWRSARTEIKEHLAKGDPVIFTLPKSPYAGGVHTMVMLGLDARGRVIVGDSLLQSASVWGENNRLIKYDTVKKEKVNTVKNITSYFNASTEDVSEVLPFYKGRKGNIGYILVYGKK